MKTYMKLFRGKHYGVFVGPNGYYVAQMAADGVSHYQPDPPVAGGWDDGKLKECNESAKQMEAWGSLFSHRPALNSTKYIQTIHGSNTVVEMTVNHDAGTYQIETISPDGARRVTERGGAGDGRVAQFIHDAVPLPNEPPKTN